MEMNEHELRLRFAESRLRACESLKQRLEKEIAELKAATVEEPPPKKRSPFAALSENEDGDRKEIEKLAKMSDDF